MKKAVLMMMVVLFAGSAFASQPCNLATKTGLNSPTSAKNVKSGSTSSDTNN